MQTNTATPSATSAVPLADFIDKQILNIGKLASWLYVLLIASIILQVTLRYGFSNGLVQLEELQWHFYGAAVMLGMSYAQVLDAHIRVDLLHMQMRRRKQAWVEILGICFLLMPFAVVIFLHSLDFVYESWRVNESSDAASGLPWRWLIKSVIPVSFVLLMLAAVSRLIRELTLLKRGEI